MGRGRAPRQNWQNIPKENADWEEYYRALNLPTSNPADFAKFKEACQKESPVTFRITGTSKDVVAVREIMQQKHINRLQRVTEWEGKPVEPPKPLSFYPDNLAWQVNVGKQVIRRNPEFSEFQRFLVVETNAGNISRQELVSMIPPLFLDVEPHHTVLDTCASPGSKTTQLIEALHKNNKTGNYAVPTGLVIANDSDYKRSHMLTHQVKRSNSPNIIVTNHDAQMYPKIWLGDSYSKFDRISCDVPCTGDATMRKNINVWKDWKVSNGQGSHQLQLNIASRSVHLMKPDGESRLVYSTCSLNPTEDEAVVAQLLRQFPNLHLVDVSNKLPTLKRMPGISDWKVQERKTKKWFDLEDHLRSDAQDNSAAKMPRSWFAPTEEEKAKFHLDRCVRVYPDQQNSGGFFIAVLELDGPAVEIKDLEAKAKAAASKEANKEEEAKNESVKPEDAQEQATSMEPSATEKTNEQIEPKTESEGDLKRKAESELPAKPAKAPKLPRDVPAFEEPFKFLPEDHPELLSCQKFYGSKPEFKMDTSVVRNAQAEPTRTIYYVAPSMKPVLEHNDQKLKVIHAGIKSFNAQRNDGECKWRVQIEGISMLNQYATKRVITTDKMDTLKNMCLDTFIRFDKMAQIDKEVHDQAVAVSEGCCIWRLNGSVYPLWRGKASVNLMAPKENTEELSLRLFDVDKKQLQKEAEAKEAESKAATETVTEAISETPAETATETETTAETPGQ